MSTPDRSPGWSVFDVEPGIRVIANAGRPNLDAETEAAVELAWQNARAETPSLFNGAVFSVDRIAASQLEGHWTEYRRIVARLRLPALADVLGVRPLAVAGLIEGPDGIVLGRRPSTAVYQPGLWQLAPAGNVDPGAELAGGIDVVAALGTELREELGLELTTMSVPRPLCLVEHPHIGILDLCLAMRTALPAEAIHAAHSGGGDGEYPEIVVVPRSRLTAWLADRGPAVAPQVALFLDRYAGLDG